MCLCSEAYPHEVSLAPLLSVRSGPIQCFRQSSQNIWVAYQMQGKSTFGIEYHCTALLTFAFCYTICTTSSTHLLQLGCQRGLRTEIGHRRTHHKHISVANRVLHRITHLHCRLHAP